MQRIEFNYIPRLIPLTMQQLTTLIQFLVRGKKRNGEAFEERVNVKFNADAKPADVAQKRTDIQMQYQAKGFCVDVYTVSPHLVQL